MDYIVGMVIPERSIHNSSLFILNYPALVVQALLF
jgi:hypothetical protein